MDFTIFRFQDNLQAKPDKENVIIFANKDEIQEIEREVSSPMRQLECHSTIMTTWTTLIILDNYFYTIKSEKQKKQEVSKNKKRQLQIF